MAPCALLIIYVDHLQVWDIHKFLNVAGLDQQENLIELYHWRAHEGCIASLDYIDKPSGFKAEGRTSPIETPVTGLVLSASADACVKLWYVSGEGGCLAGVLGAWNSWSLGDPSTFKPVPHEPPPAFRRHNVAAATGEEGKTQPPVWGGSTGADIDLAALALEKPGSDDSDSASESASNDSQVFWQCRQHISDQKQISDQHQISD